MRGDLKGQRSRLSCYDVTSSVWRAFAHNSTMKSRSSSTKVGREVVRATGWHLHQFQSQRTSHWQRTRDGQDLNRQIWWPRAAGPDRASFLFLYLFSHRAALGGCSSHHLQGSRGGGVLWRPHSVLKASSTAPTRSSVFAKRSARLVT